MIHSAVVAAISAAAQVAIVPLVARFAVCESRQIKCTFPKSNE
jgi:hypothetical protein